jgi:hypothetical protein
MADTQGIQTKLVRLEESLWQAESRFDRAHLERVLAPDFYEFGRSGRVYTRRQTLAAEPGPIDARLPLRNLCFRMLDVNTAQLTYDSQEGLDGELLHTHRSSIWTRTPQGWQLRYHQGTPFEGLPESEGS